jgi:16S rRNA (guanine(966)-N(2))-methyltransferase RsmD
MLRVIGGIYKSRRIKEVKSEKTRPTTDKNKESLFNSIGQFFDGGTMLDLFAGSGAIGIEAISRGFDSVDFVELQPQAIKVIKDNTTILGIKNCNIYKNDVFSFLKSTDNKYDFIFADPPYNLNKYNEILDIISTRHLLMDNGIIVLESDKSTEFPSNIGDLFKYKEKILGITKFSFYSKGE